MIFGYTIPQIRKAIVNLIGLLTSLLAADLLPAGWNVYVSAAIGILTVIVHFSTRNAPVTPEPAAMVAVSVTHGQHEAPELGDGEHSTAKGPDSPAV